jgi:hypothetical protein
MNINLTIHNKALATRILRYLTRQPGITIESSNNECPICKVHGPKFKPTVEKRLENIKNGKNITVFKSVDALFESLDNA